MFFRLLFNLDDYLFHYSFRYKYTRKKEIETGWDNIHEKVKRELIKICRLLRKTYIFTFYYPLNNYDKIKREKYIVVLIRGV
jgi:hypothetical protein